MPPDYRQCAAAQHALFECKKRVGLLPQQCYPAKGYKGDCDEFEFAYKRCLTTVADPIDARVLYDPKSPRQDRVQANLRLQKKLKAFDVPCRP